MSSQRHLTYLDALAAFATRGTNKSALPIMWRRNTELIAEDDHFDLLLYSSRIASLYSTGVRLWMPRHSTTTRNRLNDVLQPLGWTLRKRDLVNEYVLFNVGTGTRCDFADGMFVTTDGILIDNR